MRPMGIPVRSRSRLFGPKRYSDVKHYLSIVYMDSVLHSTIIVRSGTTSVSSTGTTSIQRTTDQGTRDEDNRST